MRQFSRFVNSVVKLAAEGGIYALMAMMLVVVGNVVCRFFRVFIQGSTYDLVELMAVVLVSFAVAYTALTGGHIIIRILISRLWPRTQAILEAFTSVLGLGIWAVAAWAGARFAWEMWLKGEEFPVVGVSVALFRYVWVLGLILLCLVLLLDLSKALPRTVRK